MSIPFAAFLSTAFDNGDYSTDDTIAFVLPLFRQVLHFHESGLVGAFERADTLYITNDVLLTGEGLAHAPVNALYRVKALPDPAYLRGYRSFEHQLGHHDPQTDIFCLGLILGGMAMGVDLYAPNDLVRFVSLRISPSLHFPRIHPTVGRLITEMTELDRSRRSQDLYDIVRRLEHYRDYDPERQSDLGQIAGWVSRDIKERETFILDRLRSRLFDISRRNRLLYYKPNMRFVNLTTGSIPMVLNYQSIRPELLFTWNPELAEKITGMKEILLNKYLRFEDHDHLPASLNTVRLESQRNIQEYGFSQLRLVIAFLHWHNLKEDATERIQSPLLLIPVTLKKNKKVKEDHYLLTVQDNAAEVNPVLANQLRELYGIRLPDGVLLDEMSPEQFYRSIQAQIEGAGQGITLRYIDQPDLGQTYKEARQGSPRRTEPHAGYPELLSFEEGIRPAGNGNNPHNWDFDVCNQVLGNFNYKKMSLVRDYNTIIDQQLQHHGFDALFGNEPRIFPEHSFDGNRPDDWFHVVAADPTQTRAILQSRAGHSYIIQGPPGTGKSQTITNLIADFVARGKNILFVCEKRAALDVVYHRLKQVGLEELCCYIHDSQDDKREFIRNLRDTYEDFVGRRVDLLTLKERRGSVLQSMDHQLELLREFHDRQIEEGKDTGVNGRMLIEKIIQLRPELVELSPRQEEELPGYQEWQGSTGVLSELAAIMEDTGADPIFAFHPFSKIQEAVFLADHPHRTLDEALEQALQSLEETEAMLNACRLEPPYLQEMDRLKQLVQFAVLLYPLAQAGNLALADPDRPEAREWKRQFDVYRQEQEVYQSTQQKNIHWKDKFPAGDLDAALVLAAKHEGAFFGRWNGGWRRLRMRLQLSYDLSAHSAGKPSYYKVLDTLKAEYTAGERVEQTRQRLQQQYSLDQAIDTARRGIDLLQSKKGHPDLDHLLQRPDAVALVASLQALHQPINRLETRLLRCLQELPKGNSGEIRDELLNIRLNTDGLRDWLPVMRAFTRLPDAIKSCLRHLPLRIKQIEAVIAKKALHQLYQAHRAFAGIDALALEKAVVQFGEGYATLQEMNAALIRAFVRHRFLQQLDLAGRPAGQLNEEQKNFKKTFTEGRKILENEFGKSMRYKSVRELFEKESGNVLRAIKPVWLMSPYSVSDSLPLDAEPFDVVIYDEASQIKLEEGVPALYRARQTIIVGDEKQMPPTDFFSARGEDPDDLDKTANGDEDWVADDADSLLAQGARKLESNLLSWHYRSHYETLISFSNHAFYGGELLTIPDKTIHYTEKPAIRIKAPEDAAAEVNSLFDRSISFHLLTNSVYEKRSNPAEADYIAHLIRELLQRRTKESIGIVAFSQQQQVAIEAALDRLADVDAEFEPLLEEAYIRTENDQYSGLIIKNLENIQGDERDIIIMSVCYGQDSRGRMLMNFGPINKKGGEKRLNVLFSRARQHMAVVSSVRYEQITNEYNEGANYLRSFLQYAEGVSEGKMTMARTILDGLAPHKSDRAVMTAPTIIREQLAEQLTGLGYQVAAQVGQSDFKCSLAVKRQPGDEAYALAILIDDEGHYRNENLIEQYYQRPAVLRSFGWKVLPVFAKDWLHQPQKVMDRIIKELGGSGAPILPLTPEVAATGPHDHLSFARLVLGEGSSGSFWERAVEGNKLIVRWGKTGTRGQTRLKTFADEDSARMEGEKQEKEQIEKGFRPL
jgi:predicted DNA-binding WGR domain protein/DNA polymerase III delta prime subunit